MSSLLNRIYYIFSEFRRGLVGVAIGYWKDIKECRKKSVEISFFSVAASNDSLLFLSSTLPELLERHPLKRLIKKRKILLIESTVTIYGCMVKDVTFFTKDSLHINGLEKLLMHCALKNYIELHAQNKLSIHKSLQPRIHAGFSRLLVIAKKRMANSKS